ncbi:Uncharacterised protein [Chlamydia trachomatis]|nr:Uncharacterised protein [Chlamydia trachomatis]
MGYNQIPTLIYTPQILDRSGSKLSKRKYVGGDSAYRGMYDEYIVNISLIKLFARGNEGGVLIEENYSEF